MNTTIPNTTTYRDLSGLATILRFCLVVYMLLALIGLWSGWQQVSLLQRASSGDFISEEEAHENDARQAGIGILQFFEFIITSIIFLRWKFLSNRNVRSFGAEGMEYTPGWSVGWYFIPIVALWKPYQAMREIFKAAHPDFEEDWQQAPHPGILPLWWALWVISNFAAQLSLRLSMRGETITELLMASWANLFSDLIDLPLAVVAIAVVATLTEWQSEKYSRLESADFAPAVKNTWMF